MREGDVAGWDEQLNELAARATLLTGNDTHIVDIDIDDLGDPAYGALVDEVLSMGIPLRGDHTVLRDARKSGTPL